MGKFSIGIDREALVNVARTAAECWHGRRLVDFIREWNIEQPWVHVSNRRYRIRVDVTELGTIEDAYNQLAYLGPSQMNLMCSINQSNGPHTSHAVAVTKTYPTRRPHMVALNSWGQVEPEIDVTAANFQLALAIDPVIVQCFEGNTLVHPASITTTNLYNQLGAIQERRNIQDRRSRLLAQELVIVRRDAEQQLVELATARHEAEQAQAARRDADRRAREVEVRARVDDGAGVVAALSNAWNAQSTEQACQRMSLSCEERANRQPAVTAGAIEAVVAAMRAYPDAPGVQEWGCKALLNVCRGPDGAAEDRKFRAGGRDGAGAFEVAVAGMCAHPQDASVQIAGCALVKELCTSLFQSRESHLGECAGEAGAIEAAVEAMRAHPLADRVQIMGGHMLYRVCRYTAVNRRRLTAEQDRLGSVDPNPARRVLRWIEERNAPATAAAGRLREDRG